MKTMPGLKIFTVCVVLTAGTVPAATTETDHAIQVHKALLFAQPLEWVGTQKPPDAESLALLADIHVFETNGASAGFGGLEKFLKAYPQSVWAPSVNVSMAEYYRGHGRYTLALAHWQAAWKTTRGSPDGTAQKIAVRTIAGWTRLLASLGEKEKLNALFGELDSLQLPLGIYATTIEETKEGLIMMNAKPGVSYRCGSYALGHMAAALHLDRELCRKLYEVDSPDGGFHLSDLLALAQTNGLAVEAVRRPAGAALVVPCVVHWKLNHYAAIVEKKGNLYRVIDPTFEGDVLMDAEAINAEASGEFILPRDKVPANWQRLTEAECAKIYGKGTPDDTHNGDDTAPECSQDDEDSNCDPPTSNDGTAGDGSPPVPPCITCDDLLGAGLAGAAIGIASAGLAGMPQWNVSEPYITLWLQDAPLTYRLSNGQLMRFRLTYKHRGEAQNSQISGFGDKWACTWIGMLQSYAGSDTVTNFMAGGGVLGFMTNGAPEYKTARAFFDVDYGSGDPPAIVTAMGAMNVYNLSFAADLFGTTNSLLTQRLDRYGRTLEQFNYQTVAGVTRMTTMLDMDGRTNVLSYGNSTYPDLITAVTDPYGSTAYFNYDANGRLTNIVDMQGMSSYFQYDSSERITNLITPYGSTAFQYFDGADTNDSGALVRALLITEPTGDHQLYVFRDHSPEGDTRSPLNTGERLTYHWNRSQYLAISDAGKANVLSMPVEDYGIAPVKSWLHHGQPGGTFVVGDTLDQMADPYDPAVSQRPGYLIFHYLGESDDGVYDNAGAANTLQRITAIHRDVHQNPILTITRNYWGHPTSYVYQAGSDTMLYTNVFDSSGQNLQNEHGPRNEPTRNYVFDPARTNLLIAVTNAAGDYILYTHDTNTLKVTSIAFSGGLVRTNIYYASGPSKGFLEMQIDLGFHTNSFAYANGNLMAQTNELGLVTSYLYDNLNRLVSTAFPDGTTISNVYNNLDLVATKDRLNQWTYYGYNALRQLTAVTNANGQITQYDYCNCGSPDEIIRWNGASQLISWFNYDIGGRLTNAIYPDGYQLNYSYDVNNNTTYVTDGDGNYLWFNYFQDGLLFKLADVYLNANQLLALSFDEYGRVTSSTDRNYVQTQFGYDFLDRLVSRQSFGSDGTQTGQEGFAYNSLGLTCYTDQLGHLTTYVRDAAGRVLYETNANNQVLQFTYNPADELSTLTDGKNQTTTWNYDQYGRVTNKVDTLGTNIFVYQYDPLDRLTNRWTPAKGATVYRYDPIGNLTNVIYPTSSNIVFLYDPLNRLTNMVDGLGVTAFSWTDGNQLAGETGPWPNDAVSYTYVNRLRTGLSLQAPNADVWAQSYIYDSAMQLTNVTSPAGSFTYSYQPSSFGEGDRVAELFLPGGGSYENNNYDTLMRLMSTTLNSTRTGLNEDFHSYQYDEGSEVTQQMFTAENVMNYTYDNIGQLKMAQGLESGGTARLQEQFGYAYDAAWNLNARTNNALIQSFAVNSLNELSSASRSGTLTVAGTTTEPSGNVTNVTVNGASAYEYADGTFAAAGFTPINGNNTFTAIAQDTYGRGDTNSITAYLPASPSYSYDLNGNLLSDGTRHFTYDNENQLVSVWVTNAWSNSLAYDGLLRKRIERDYSWNGSSWAETNEVRYVYDGYLAIQERDWNNIPQVTYTRGVDLSGSFEGAGGIGGLLARTDMGQWIAGDPNANAFYHSDGNGNITCMVNTNGIIVAQYEYDPYGNVLSMSGTLAAANHYRFSSKEWNDNAGLYYYGFRFYDPNLQRWPNRDPMSELNDINLYRFVYNNANFWIDPFGLECQFSVGIGGTLGGGANGGFGLFGGGGMSLGFTTSGQLFVQFQAAGMGGSGVYAGVGVQGSISHSDTPTPGGISTQEALHAEINADDLVGGGYSTDQNKDSRGMSFPIPHVRVAVGLGAMAGLGQSTTTTIATPPLGQYFPPMQGTIYTPVTNVNAPPNVVTAPCNCNH